MSTLLSAPAAAQLMGVARNTVGKWIRTGRLPATRDDLGNYVIRRDELFALRDAATAGHGPECAISTDPFGPGHECHCTACHCPSYERANWLGECARCHRPLIVDGQVYRP